MIELQDLCCGGSILNRVMGRRARTALLAIAAVLASMALGYHAHGYLGNSHRFQDGLNAGTNRSSNQAAQQTDQTLLSKGSSAEKPTVSLLPHDVRAYILQLGSFNTLATTLRAVDIYKRKGIEAHWNVVRLGKRGLWYRVFVGRFTSIETARQYQNNKDVADTQILFAPWAVLLDQSGPSAHIASVRAHLQSHGVDSYIAPAQNGLSHLCAGAFISRSRAEEIARQIQQQTGVATRVANFHSTLVSGSPHTEVFSRGETS